MHYILLYAINVHISIGMFRLAKVNCDSERSVAQALDVSSLPSVFAVKDGKVTDK